MEEIITMNNINKTAKKSMMKRFSLYLTCLMMFALVNSASSQCSGITMSCNSGIQISLNSTTSGCIVVVTPEMVLQNLTFPSSDYTVVLTDEDGNVIPNASVDASHIGMNLSATVNLPMCGLSCWGTLTVEDKLPPVILCPAPITIECTDDSDPLTATNSDGVTAPTVADCSEIVGFNYEDLTGPLICSETYGWQIDRVWFATDASGNSSSCTQTIFINRGDLADVTIPADLNLECMDALALNSNFPNPSVTGMPTGVECSNILHQYSDSVIDLCGPGQKILRTWQFVDWCTGVQLNGVQIIKVEDTEAPVVSCPAEVGVPDNFTCEAPDATIYEISIYIEADASCETTTYTDVLAPELVVECSSYTWIVGYKYGNGTGDEPDPNLPFEYTNVKVTGYTGNQPNFEISGLPIGPSWLKYTVTDACGHVTDCFTEVWVYDVTAPYAICEGGTILSLGLGECETLYATSLDDGSYDNCGNVSFLISRTGSNYQESVEFCCSDANNQTNTVYLLVTDECDNTSVCTGNVVINDLVPPTISCPSNRTVSCGSSTDPSVTGMPTVTGNCTTPTFSHSDGPLLNENCNTGYFIRTWTATSASNQTVTCTQTITIAGNDPLQANDISWGSSTLQLTGCLSGQSTDPSIIGGAPTVNNTSPCVDIAITYTDEVVNNTSPSNDFCHQIIRTWKVVDWCVYDPNSPIDFFEFEQQINLTGGAAPVFPTCNDVEIVDGHNDCQGYINLTKTATDDCSAILAYSWTLDLHDNGTVEHTGLGATMNGLYPSGTHKGVFTAVDDCGNVGECVCYITIDDEVAPTPICYAEVIWPMGPGGTTEVWASDFNIKSEDTCDPSDVLSYSFTADGNTPAMEFTCADIPNGIGAEIPLQMYVLDSEGNAEFCTVTLVLQDTGDYCTDVNGAGARVSGEIMSETGEEVENVEVELMNITDNAMIMDMTNQTGNYAFNAVDYYDGYAINPKKDTDHMNGVSTLDLVLIQKHILMTDTLDSPYKMIAADINASSNISATDLIELRKLILGIHETFQNNEPFVFVDQEYEFVDPRDPWAYDSTIDINSLFVNEEEADFVAVKIGDVNNSAAFNSAQESASNRSSGEMKLMFNDQEFKAGQEVELSLNLEESMDLVGFQFAIATNGMLDLIDTKATGLADFGGSNFAKTEDGLVISWNQLEAVNTERIMTLKFVATVDGYLSEALTMTDDVRAEVYNDRLEVLDLSLEASTEIDAAEGFVLYQNKPNPFTDNSEITFYTENSDGYTLDFIDINGRLVHTVNAVSSKGVNRTMISTDDLSGTGIYYYRLTINNQVETKKMIVMK